MALETRKTVCMFCSMGCGMLIASDRGNPVEIEYDFENTRNKGSLCSRGNYVFELLGHRRRAQRPMIKQGDRLEPVSFEDAVKHAAEKIKDVISKHGADSVGILMSPDSFNEEVFLAGSISKKGIKGCKIAVAFPEEDRSMLAADDEISFKGEKAAKLEDISRSDLLLVIGDVLTKAPCVSKEINKVKYGGKDNKVIVIDPKNSHTAWFASPHLRVFPGAEAHLMAGITKAMLEAKDHKSAFAKKFKDIDLEEVSEQTGVSLDAIKDAANSVADAKKAVIIICSNPGKTHDPGLIVKLSKALAAAAKGDVRVMVFYSAANSLGAHLTLQAECGGKSVVTPAQMLDEAKKGKLKALVSLGVDLTGISPDDKAAKALSKLKFFMVSDMFMLPAAKDADVFIPSASSSEKKGSVVSAGEDTIMVDPAISPYCGSRSYFDILSALIGALGGESPPIETVSKTAKEAFKKIKDRPKDNISPVLSKLDGIKKIKPQSGGYVLLGDDDLAHYLDMNVSSRCFWAAEKCPAPYIEISEEDSADIGVSNNDEIKISSAGVEGVLPARISKRVPKGVVSVPHHFAQARALLKTGSDKKSGLSYACPASVLIEKG